ncbi:hypothetical protein CVV38_02195 [Candidatus Peregrinibacteria bacterium HGW-Peregrinibacteria-1]|jgi:hypothetical protein|nr:MAG: hypothetical protein CVV38_02195 [Candidatus Peregrinibacteria bacterium HGW-Peregrinibacteria-1]
MSDQTIYKSDAVVVDKNKTAEQYIAEVEKIYIVPDLIREKYPDLMKLIYETESMDKEEREYWLQIMPIMNDEQVVKLRDIMVNEQVQLSEIENKYSEKKPVRELDENAIRERQEKLRAAEATSSEKDRAEEEKLLKELSDLGF